MSNEDQETARTMLKILTGKTKVFFMRRCNESIRISMRMAVSMGKSHGLMQDEGGWMTYEKYITKAGMHAIRMVTTDGLIHPKELSHYGSDEVLLINSLAGYIATQKMDIINDYSIQKDIFVVNDVCGSIGLPVAKFGDIIVGSFGYGKPIDLGCGGFIAFNDEYVELFEQIAGDDFSDFDMDFKELSKKLKGLEVRRTFLTDRCKKVKADLANRNIVHSDDQNAVNVVVRFKDDDEKAFLETYCRDNELEFTVCPREIRIIDDAISIEVKRLKNS